MNSKRFHWPDNYPENCPPSDATAPNSVMYRLYSAPFENRSLVPSYRAIENCGFQIDRSIVHNPINDDDFQSEYELSERLRSRLEAEGNSELICRSRGLPVFGELSGAISTRKRIRRFRKSFIAGGTLTKEHGLLKPTPSQRSHRTHCTWWVPDGVEPETIFEIVRE